MQNLPMVTAPAAPLPINSVQELEILGKIVAQSNLFGKRNPAEGLAIVAMCHQKRISWLDFMQTFHMIQGVVSKKTDAMIADLHRIGGTHKPLTRTPEKAEAFFKLGDSEYTSTITWEECLAEPFVYQGKESDVLNMLQCGQKPPLKAKYTTPRSRMQMLWARCVSDGVRVVAPECVQGIYTPEEASDYVAEQNQPSAPMAAQGMVSPSPLAAESVEVVPVGKLAGQRWDTLETAALQQALATPSPYITTEMKDYIRSVLAVREKAAAAPVSQPTEADTVEPEVVEEVVHV